jgi:ribose transport system ATP-binding protein
MPGARGASPASIRARNPGPVAKFSPRFERRLHRPRIKPLIAPTILEAPGHGPALSCTGVTKHYGGVRALRGVDWELRAGEVHALCGENGAGKSTLARICAGIARPDSGEIRLGGRAVAWSGSDEARRAGIGIILQELDLFANLTVAENIALGNPALEARRWVSFEGLARAVKSCLLEAGVTADPGTVLGELGVSQWQLVAIARVLSLEARVIFMDEPTSALTDDAVERLFDVIGRLKARGVAIAYVSHKMSEIFRVCDRISVMRDGEMIATSGRDDTTIEKVIQQMVGRPVKAHEATPPAGPRISVLGARNLATRKLRGISFDLARGEILGVAGLVAAGRSELGRALFGMSPLTGGTITLADGAYRPTGVCGAKRRGLALVPEDRRRDGLFMGMSVRENTTLAALGRYAMAGWINRAREAQATREQLSQSRAKYRDDSLPVDALSGGNQQKVLLGKWLLTRPGVCFLDDPTRGIDVGAKDDIYRMIADLARDGVGMLWVSSELPELIANSHRIMVLHEGALQGILDSASATQESVMRLATGRGAATP